MDMRTKQPNFKICICNRMLLRNGRSKICCQKINILTYYFDSLLILACNIISLISFDKLESQLLFDVLCIKMDQEVLEISTKTLTYC